MWFMMAWVPSTEELLGYESLAVEDILKSDPLFFELARTLVQENFYNTVFKRMKGSLREMREDHELTPMLLFVNPAGISERVYDDKKAFREVAAENLGALLVQEANPDGFVDEFGVYQDPSDGGYSVRLFKDGRMFVSRERELYELFESAVAAHNEACPEVHVEKFKDLLPHYLPADFSSYTGRALKVGGRTQGALAAALGGDDTTKSYIVKQTVYDGVTGKLARFGRDGIEMEFFLYRLHPNDDRADSIESFHPSHKIIGILRVYEDVKTREVYHIGPGQLGLDVPEPVNKVACQSIDEMLGKIDKT